MLATIKGVYDHGKIILTEEAPVHTKTDVIITFLTGDEEKSNHPPKRLFGGMEGKIDLPDNFNDPLDELKDYM